MSQGEVSIDVAGAADAEGADASTVPVSPATVIIVAIVAFKRRIGSSFCFRVHISGLAMSRYSGHAGRLVLARRPESVRHAFG
jgi:hypothetical protein